MNQMYIRSAKSNLTLFIQLLVRHLHQFECRKNPAGVLRAALKSSFSHPHQNSRDVFGLFAEKLHIKTIFLHNDAANAFFKISACVDTGSASKSACFKYLYQLQRLANVHDLAAMLVILLRAQHCG